MGRDKKSIGFDWIWNVLPEISFYHVWIVTIAGYVGTIGGYTAVFPVFAQYKQSARCTNALDDPAYADLNMTFDEITALNNVTKEPFDECQYYQLDYEDCDVSDKSLFLQCANDLPKNVSSKCDSSSVVWDTSLFLSSVPSEFDLACERLSLNSLATSLSFIGLFFGAMSAGYFSDNYGRRITIVVAIGLNALFWVLQAALPSYAAFVVLRILVQGANQAAYLTYNCYACEIVGPNGRAYTGMIPNFTFAFGYMFMSLLSYYVPEWRPLTYILAALSAPFLATYWLWPESPRWLYSVKRYDEAEKTVMLFVKKCKVDLDKDFQPETSAAKVDISSERAFLDTLKNKCTANEGDEKVEVKKYSVVNLFTSGKYLALTSLNIAFQFIVIVMAYYGLSFGAGSLPGDVYVNNVINGAVEVCAYVAAFFLLNVFGRRLLTAGPLLISGISMIVGMLIKEFVGGEVGVQVFRWLMFAGKFGVSGSFAVIWIYSAELFPTDIRTNAMAMGSMAGRFGGIISPFINDFYETIPWLPPTIFGTVCVAGGCLLFLLPETLGKPLLNTIDEAEKYYARRTSTFSARDPNESARSIN